MEKNVVPAAPAHLTEAAAAKWQKDYRTAYAQAKIAMPDNERAQRVTALKSANAMLAVPAPESAADVDRLEDWQVLKKGVRVTKAGVTEKFCVTTDGRKYAFPVIAPASPSSDLSKMTKDQLVAHAAEVHGLALDPSTKKDELVAAIQDAAAK